LTRRWTSTADGLWDTAQRAGKLLAKSLIGARVDTARARALLDQERRRLQQLGRAVARDHDDAVAASSPEDQVDGADRRVTEETSQALSERLGDRWAALERAEARLAAGTYGASVLSGRPIPDERLEAFPLAELTVQEAAERDRDPGGRREPESRMGPSSDPFRVFDDPAAQDDRLVEDERSDDEPGPQANLGIRTTPET
jgi:DnaK suppressor protein